MDCNAHTWFDAELNNCRFKDERLKNRFRALIENLWNSIGKPIPCRFQQELRLLLSPERLAPTIFTQQGAFYIRMSALGQ